MRGESEVQKFGSLEVRKSGLLSFNISASNQLVMISFCFAANVASMVLIYLS